MAFTETWLTSDYRVSELAVSCISLIRTDSLSGRAGGVAVYHQDDFPPPLMYFDFPSHSLADTLCLLLPLRHWCASDWSFLPVAFQWFWERLRSRDISQGFHLFPSFFPSTSPRPLQCFRCNEGRRHLDQWLLISSSLINAKRRLDPARLRANTLPYRSTTKRVSPCR